MNREEAFKYFNYLYQYVTTKDGIEAYQIALSVLLGPQPDPITGLMPCGCGGAAHFCSSSGDEPFYLVECEKCEIETIYYSTKNKAREAWNIAMGGMDINKQR